MGTRNPWFYFFLQLQLLNNEKDNLYPLAGLDGPVRM